MMATAQQIATERVALVLARGLRDPRHNHIRLAIDETGEWPTYYLDVDQISGSDIVTNRYRLVLEPS